MRGEFVKTNIKQISFYPWVNLPVPNNEPSIATTSQSREEPPAMVNLAVANNEPSQTWTRPAREEPPTMITSVGFDRAMH